MPAEYLSAGMYLQSSVYHGLNHIFVDRFCDLTRPSAKNCLVGRLSLSEGMYCTGWMMKTLRRIAFFLYLDNSRNLRPQRLTIVTPIRRAKQSVNMEFLRLLIIPHAEWGWLWSGAAAADSGCWGIEWERNCLVGRLSLSEVESHLRGSFLWPYKTISEPSKYRKNAMRRRVFIMPAERYRIQGIIHISWSLP
jgi:hypothetical protein